MASLTIHIPRNVALVIKEYEIRKHMHFYPLNGSLGLVGLDKFCNMRTVLLGAFYFTDNRVTIHADAQRRHGGVSRLICSHVTVHALDLHRARMQLV